MFRCCVSFSRSIQVRRLWFRTQLVIPFRHLDIQDSPNVILAVRCPRWHRQFANLSLNLRISKIMLKTSVVNSIVCQGRSLNKLGQSHVTQSIINDFLSQQILSVSTAFYTCILKKYKTFSVLIYSYINTSGKWKNEKLCGKTTPGGRSVTILSLSNFHEC